MSEISRQSRPVLAALALLLAGALLPTALQGQAAASANDQATALAEVRARVDALRDSVRIAKAAYDRARADITASLTDTLTVGTRRVLIAPHTLSDADIAALREALERHEAELRERFGPSASALLDSIPWQLTRRPGGRSVSITARADEGAPTVAPFTLPLDREALQRFARSQAGVRARTLHPALPRFVGGELTLTPDSTQIRLAKRSLALGSSSVGRRCALGAVGSCRALLTDATGDAAKSLWYAADDEAASLRYPYSAHVRSSFGAHALSLGGADAINRLQAADRNADPLSVLATVAGMSPDAVIESWTKALDATDGTARAPMLPITLGTLAWCGLLVVVATRRRQL